MIAGSSSASTRSNCGWGWTANMYICASDTGHSPHVARGAL